MYAWVDFYLWKYLLEVIQRGEKVTWFSLGECWQQIKGVGNVAIVRRSDCKIVYYRGLR